MKRILAYILTLSLIVLPFPAWADDETMYQPVASGTIVAGGLKVSATGTNDFVDLTAATYLPAAEGANPLPLHQGQLLRVKDSAGRVIQTWIGAAGTGETVGADILEGIGAFTSDVGWNLQTGWSVSGGKLNKAGTDGQSAYALKGASLGWLTKIVVSMTDYASGGGAAVSIKRGGGTEVVLGTMNAVADYAYYGTVYGDSAFDVFNIGADSSNQSFSLDNVAYYRVLTPSIAGVWAAQSKGSAVKTIPAKDASFNFNDASGYSYEILKSTAAPVIQSYDVPAGSLMMDSTTGVGSLAMMAPLAVGGAAIDLSYAQVGGYDVAIYQSNVLVAWARVKAEAPGGEAVSGTELITGWTNSITGPYDTFTFSGSDITSAISATSARAVTNAISYVTGALYKRSVSLTVNSGAVTWDTFFAGETPTIASDFSDGAKYLTAVAGNDKWGVYNSGAVNFATSGYSLQRVTECASTGLHLTSGDGVTRGFIYKSATLNEHAAATVRVIYRGAQ